MAAASMSGALDIITLGKNRKPVGIACEGAFLKMDELEGVGKYEDDWYY